MGVAVPEVVIAVEIYYAEPQAERNLKDCIKIFVKKRNIKYPIFCM
jgi:hypothetical protein